MRRLYRSDCKLHRRHSKTLVGEDLGSCWMIDRHEPQQIVVIGFPKLARNPEIIEAIAWHKLVAANLVPLLGGLNPRRANRVDAQTDRRTPRHRIFHELHGVAVPGEEKWAGTFEALLGQDWLICLERELCTHRAVGPHNARHVDARLFAEAEVKFRPGDRWLLRQQPRANLNLAPNAE